MNTSRGNLTLEKYFHAYARLEQYMQLWGVMILPRKTFDLIIEFTKVVGSATHIEHPKIALMSLF